MGESWDWGLILGAVAAVLAVIVLPTVFQMFWGKPKLKFEFETFDGDEGRRLLICAITNERVSKRWLRVLGVFRQPVEISGGFDIVDSATGEDVTGIVHAAFRTHPEDLVHAVNLAPPIPAGLIVVWHRDDAVGALDYDGDLLKPLRPGSYTARIAIHAGDDTFVHHRDFVIGVSPQMTKWAD